MSKDKVNIVMWTEPDKFKRAALGQAARTATEPVRKAYSGCKWFDSNLMLVFGSIPKAQYTALYFWLSGYGDACWQHEQSNHRQQPPSYPTSK